MENNCQEHDKRRGFCSTCGGCKGCDSLAADKGCILQHRIPNHLPKEERIRLKRLRRQERAAAEPPTVRSQLSRTVKDDLRSYVDLEVEEVEHANEKNSPTGLTEIISSLGFTQEQLGKFYRKGAVSKEDFEASPVVKYRVHSLFGKLVKRLSQHLLSDDAEVLITHFSDKNCGHGPNECTKVVENLGHLCIKGDRLVRQVSKAVLAVSGTRKFCQKVVADNGHVKRVREKVKRRLQEAIWKPVQTFCPKSCTRYKKLGKMLLEGRPLPKQTRVCKVPVDNILKLMEWVSSNLRLKPATLRTVKLPTGDLFQGVPVYERTGETEASVFVRYKKDCGVQNVGRVLFKDCLRLLTKPSKQQTGVSDRFVDFMHLSETIRSGLDRVLTYFPEEAEGEESRPLRRAQLLQLIALLGQQVTFLKHGYKKVLRTSSTNGFSCTSYALGQKCDHVHTWPDGQVKDIFLYPDHLVSSLRSLLNDELTASQKRYVEDMIDGVATVGIAEWNRFPKHVLRTFHQEKEIYDMMNSLQPGQGYVITDYKQKINPEANMESAVEYYGKKGMSLLGFMVFFVDETGERRRFFVDLIPVNTSCQNSTAVQVAFEVFLGFIREHFPFLKTVIIQSDNAANFSCPDNLVFVACLNSTARYPFVTRWINTEAGAGNAS